MTGLSASAKYWALIGLGLVLAVGTYLSGQTTVTYAVVLSAVMVGVTFLIGEFEAGPASTPPASP